MTTDFKKCGTGIIFSCVEEDRRANQGHQTGKSCGNSWWLISLSLPRFTLLQQRFRGGLGRVLFLVLDHVGLVPLQSRTNVSVVG